MNMKNELVPDLNRRHFLKGGSFATLMLMMGGVPLDAADEPKPADAPAADGATNYKGQATPINVGVIGCGPWARELLKTLSLIPNGPVVAVCDTYPAMLKRAGDLATNAKRYADYKELLADKTVQAVVVATPSHLHREVVLDAFKAGKHVYCEAPLASSVEEARAIAGAARENFRLNFQVGLQNRSDRQIYSLAAFIRSGVLGKPLKARQQFHKKQSWRFPSPNPDREKAINWRLEKGSSSGLVGELGIHQIDVANWFFNSPPLAITGFGSLVQWKDGREVPDNIQALIEYPGGVFLQYEATLGNSFDAEMGTFFGTDCAIMMRERRAWMFKEADAPLLGWEVYARKDAFYKESGIVLGAGNTNQKAQAKQAASSDVVDEKSALQYSLEAFLKNSDLLGAGVEDFKANFDANDLDAMKEHVANIQKEKSWQQAAGWREGLQATVTVIKANEAITAGKRIAFDKAWIELG
jgi:predicted dehydrogenase